MAFYGNPLSKKMGVLGEYLWRALDESRRRPRYLIEATTIHNLNSTPETEDKSRA